MCNYWLNNIHMPKRHSIQIEVKVDGIKDFVHQGK